MTLRWLEPGTPFPDASTALDDPNGLLAIGGDLSPPHLLSAYQRGIFPWFGPGDPILWWSPDPRMVLFPEEFRISRSLRKRLIRGEFTFTFNRDFDAVVRSCATAPREGQPGTWIVPAMQQAYRQLHTLGYAHSVEVWQAHTLVGGLYGVALGNVFYGESMFSTRTDASKAALATLATFLAAQKTRVIDCQMHTPHLASLGARLIPRNVFLALLPQEEYPPPKAWPEAPPAVDWRTL